MRRPLVWLVVGLYALAAVTTAIGLADPGDSRGSASDVNMFEDPGWVAFAALGQTAYRDYAVTIERSPPAGHGSFPTYLAVDYEDREYVLRRSYVPESRRVARVEYGNSYRTWSAAVPEPGPGDWRSDSSEWGDIHLFDVPIYHSGWPVETVRSNGTVVVVNVTDTETVIRLFSHLPDELEEVDGFRAYALVTVDREAGAPRRVTVVTSEPSETEGERFRTRTVMRFSEWDQADVSRPASIPYSVVEILDDAVELDGPIGGVR